MRSKHKYIQTATMLSLPSAPLRSTTHGFRVQSIASPSITSSRAASRISDLARLKMLTTTALSSCSSRQRRTTSHAIPVKIITRPTSTDSAAVAPSSTPASPRSTPLAWNEYFTLRRSRRNYNLIASIGACACTTTGGAILTDNYSELIGTWMALEPIPMALMGIVASAAVGWLSGPMFGSAVFRMLHRRVSGEMIEVRIYLLSCAVDLTLRPNYHRSVERKGLLHSDKEVPCRPFGPIYVESCSRFLWRKDWECCGFQDMDERPEGIQ